MGFRHIGDRIPLVAIVSMLAIATGAHAQAAAPTAPATLPAADATPAAAASPEAAGVGEIVVTAQRRSQRLQDVPIAVSVVGGKALATQGITSSRDLATIVPGLVQDQKAAAPLPYLRGIGQNVSIPGIESPVVTYVDGLYLVSPVSGNADLGDVEQIEVLKGPQGTTFGRNAVAGVINITTRMPSYKPEFQGTFDYSSYDTKQIKAYGSTRLTDNLAVGLAVSWRDQGDGWGRNTYLNIPAFYSNSLNIRGKAKWQPGSRVTVVASGFYQHQNSDLGSFSLMPGTIAVSSGVDYTNSGFYNTINNNPIGFVGTGAGGSVKASIDFDWATLSDQLGYQHVHAESFSEGDFTPDPRLLLDQNFVDKAITNELLLSSKGDSRLSWLGGFFFLHQDTTNYYQQFGKALPGNYVLINARQTTNSYAPFANVTWAFLPRAHITLGARGTFETRNLLDSNSVSATGVVTPVPDGSIHYNQFTYRASLDYKVGPVMLYGSINRGATAGVYQLSNPGLPPLKPATLTAYEIGAKSELFDRKLMLNVALFDYDYQNIVVTARSPTDGTTRLQNAAKARVRGIDVDFTAHPVSRLTLSGGFEILDAKYTNFPAASIFTPNPLGGNIQSIADVSGDYLLNAPKFSLVATAIYTIPTPIGKLDLSGNISHKSAIFFNVNNNLKQDAYNIENASATLTLPGDRYSIGVYAKNIGNVHYNVDMTRTAIGTSHLPGEPRIVGVRFGVKL
jgi:iron complex outermembrane receptor protein